VPDLYPDALPCLRTLRREQWRVVVGGNQPTAFQQLVEDLDLPVDLVTSSGELGAEKPAREFYLRLAERAGAAPEQCVHVGDRVDNDVVGAAAAGMTVVHLQRGPWGLLHADDPATQAPGVHRLRSLEPLPSLLRRLRGS
jgi:HAD superfamily hydrolase (TIGR01509 family)